MYNTAQQFGRNNAANQYLVKEIMEASQEKLLIKVYDFAILNCQRHNLAKTNKALQVLIDALRFDDEASNEISGGLFRLYQFCQDQMREGNYNMVYKTLTELKKSWQDVFNNKDA